jgi:hypothetical protein
MFSKRTSHNVPHAAGSAGAYPHSTMQWQFQEGEPPRPAFLGETAITATDGIQLFGMTISMAIHATTVELRTYISEHCNMHATDSCETNVSHKLSSRRGLFNDK